ncbi:MAG: protein Asterix [archaeon]|nr:protein Asterix [archaeon]
MYSGDPKRPKNITYYPMPKQEEEQTDIIQFLSMIFGIVSFIFRYKWAIWVALILFFISWVNSRYTVEQKNSIMNFGLILSGFFMIYLAPNPRAKGPQKSGLEN